MEKSSGKMDYEKAAILRDRIKALTQIQSSQNIRSTNLDNADVISVAQEAGKTCVQVFFYRSKQNWTPEYGYYHKLQLPLVRYLI